MAPDLPDGWVRRASSALLQIPRRRRRIAGHRCHIAGRRCRIASHPFAVRFDQRCASIASCSEPHGD
jgi:hypothetical protein